MFFLHVFNHFILIFLQKILGPISGIFCKKLLEKTFFCEIIIKDNETPTWHRKERVLMNSLGICCRHSIQWSRYSLWIGHESRQKIRHGMLESLNPRTCLPLQAWNYMQATEAMSFCKALTIYFLSRTFDHYYYYYYYYYYYNYIGLLKIQTSQPEGWIEFKRYTTRIYTIKTFKREVFTENNLKDYVQLTKYYNNWV